VSDFSNALAALAPLALERGDREIQGRRPGMAIADPIRTCDGPTGSSEPTVTSPEAGLRPAAAVIASEASNSENGKKCWIASSRSLLAMTKKSPYSATYARALTRASRSVCCPSAARIARAAETLVCVTYQKPVGVGIAYLPCL
jgi:hypothetical protein